MVHVHGEFESGSVVQPAGGKGSNGSSGHLLLMSKGMWNNLAGAFNIFAEFLHVTFQLGSSVLEPCDHLQKSTGF